jgi:hypothetical protein
MIATSAVITVWREDFVIGFSSIVVLVLPKQTAAINSFFESLAARRA